MTEENYFNRFDMHAHPSEEIYSIGHGHPNLDDMVLKELEAARLLCWKDGRLIPEMVDKYAELCKRVHHTGIDCYKHNCKAANYYKQLMEYKHGRK